MFDHVQIQEWHNNMPKCGCGRVGRYETPTGLACNKHMRCDNAEFMAEQIHALTAERDKLKSALEAITKIEAGLVTTTYDMRRIAQEALKETK